MQTNSQLSQAVGEALRRAQVTATKGDADLAGDLTTLAGIIDTLQATLTSVEATLADHETRIADLEP